MTNSVVVVIGVGGMGQLIARRQGSGRTLLVADHDEDLLGSVTEVLRGEGFEVLAHRVDVGDPASVDALAQAASAAGSVDQVIHTAGVSPVTSTTEAVVRVDVLGVAHMLDAFGEVIAEGGAGLVIASMAGHFAAGTMPGEVEASLASAPSEELAALPVIAGLTDAGSAYSVAKRANQVRVAAASLAWGRRGARINSISPGVIATPMGQAELAGESGAFMRAMIEASGTGRVGTPADIAAAAAFLLGPEASFITGTDLAVDGGVVAAVRNGALSR